MNLARLSGTDLSGMLAKCEMHAMTKTISPSLGKPWPDLEQALRISVQRQINRCNAASSTLA
jgi:hypothetical protein